MGQTGHMLSEGAVITVAQILVVCPFTQLCISSLKGIFWAEANDLQMEHMLDIANIKGIVFLIEMTKKVRSSKEQMLTSKNKGVVNKAPGSVAGLSVV